MATCPTPTPAEIARRLTEGSARRGLGTLGDDTDDALARIALRAAANGSVEMLQAMAERRERATEENRR